MQAAHISCKVPVAQTKHHISEDSNTQNRLLNNLRFHFKLFFL
jgi:hypothetical protein